MIRRIDAILAASLVCLVLPAAPAAAQYNSYPPPPPYRGPPPPYVAEDRLPPPGYWRDDDDDDLLPLYQRRMPRQRTQSGPPSRILPYPDDAEVVPPPPGFAVPGWQRVPPPGNYGHQLNDAPRPGVNDNEVLRPPSPLAPRAAPQPIPRTTTAALPPEDQPETGEPKELPPHLKRQMANYPTKEPAGTVIVDTANTYLYMVLGGGKAIRYGIGVGREGFTWSGTERISKLTEWPDWHPPAEMIERQPYLPRFMAGGDGNPLGARALYLGKTLYRIHGTNQPSTIGQTVSSGCIRLLNRDIEDLYARVQVGTRVVVLPGNKPPETAATAASASNAPAGPPPANIAPPAGNSGITQRPLPPIR